MWKLGRTDMRANGAGCKAQKQRSSARASRLYNVETTVSLTDGNGKREFMGNRIKLDLYHVTPATIKLKNFLEETKGANDTTVALAQTAIAKTDK